MTGPNAPAWEIPQTGACPVADTLRLLGGKHKPRIIHCLYAEERHFLELVRALGHVSRKVLVEQLRDLETNGLVERREINDARRRVSYRLSAKGLSLCRILNDLHDWAVANTGYGEAPLQG